MAEPADRTMTGARCNGCGTEVRSGEPFCSSCGAAVACRHCGQAFQPEDRFCPSCGTSRTTQVSAEEATKVSSPWDLVLAKLRRATVGEFDIKGEIGRGGMAAVYLAHEMALDRKVAIKVMSPSLLMGQGMAQRFRQEAITVANLNHQHIITIHAVRQFEDLQYFVMQWVDGCSLETIIKRAGPMPVPAARALLYHVGSALAHAHAHGVIHRDVKPGNILASRHGQALVTDFGIAKVMESPSNTQTGMVVGTPAYMSPEQCRSGEVTWRSDQYALGIVAYEMIAGAAPFGGTTLSVIHAQVHDPVPRLDERAQCPTDLADAIHRMLAKDPDDRFPTMAEALRTLGALPMLPGDPVQQEIAGLVGSYQSQASMPTTPVSPLMRRTPEGMTTVVTGEKAGADAAGTAEAATTPIPAAVPTANTTPIPELAPRPEPKPNGATRAPVVTASPARPRGRRWVWALLLLVVVAGVVLWNALAPSASTGRVAVPAGPTGGSALAPDSAGTGEQMSGGPVATVTITEPSGTLRPGSRETLQARVMNAAGGVLAGREVRWQSSDPGIARIDAQTGRLEAVKAGPTTITAAAEGISTTLRLVVAAAARPGGQPTAVASVARVTVSPAALELVVDSSGSLVAQARSADGSALGGREARWSVADGAIATVSSRGLVRAVAPGSTTVRVVIDGRAATVSVTVRQPMSEPVRLAVRQREMMVEVGSDVRLQADLTDRDGQPHDGRVTWQSRSPKLLRVDSSGRASGVAPGTAWAIATAGDLSDSLRVVVGLPTAVQLRRTVDRFLAALSARDGDAVAAALQPRNELQQQLADKLLEKVRGGNWDLQTDTLPRGYATHVSGDRAEADFIIELAWKNSFGGRKREQVNFRAVFARQGAEWRLKGILVGPETEL